PPLLPPAGIRIFVLGRGRAVGKIAIIGAGAVGATLAYTLTLKGIVSEFALVDTNREKAEAEVLDITHAMPLGHSVKAYASGYEACADAAIVVVTAGAKQRPGETRVELLGRNAAIARGIVESVYGSGFSGVLLMISNPVDALTYVAHRVAVEGFGAPPQKVIGSGTVLDSARFREFLAGHCDVNPGNIHGYVLGEHGDSSFPAWSLTTIGGVGIDRFCAECGGACETGSLLEEAQASVRQAAEAIIAAKGATYYGIAQAASVIVQAILRNERRILPVSTVRLGYRGIGRTAFSFPTIVGAGGAEKVLDFPLSEEDERKLLASARYVAGVIEGAGL
ncbi:MAG TPA: L-lactate dehydrogenase, partial [Rectinemataceae bacterium]|nr:L-lactate dehydrogenase [Rectinemataceae bacterium]